jgi:cell division protein FtsL
MKNFILKHIKPISIVVGIILISYLIYLGVDMYTQNKINERIDEEKKKIDWKERENENLKVIFVGRPISIKGKHIT